MPARYGPRFVECPACGNPVRRGAGSCPACGHRFHYWYVAAAVLALLMLLALLAYLLGFHP
jgi:hypothetical protein